MCSVLNAPNEVSITFSFQRSRIAERREELANRIRVRVIVFKFNPWGFGGKFAQLMHQTDKIIGR